MGPAKTGTILVISGHGAISSETFNFQRSAESKITLYSYIFENISIWDEKAGRVERKALDNGEIDTTYVQIQESRIGGTQIKNYELYPPDGLKIYTPQSFNKTPIRINGCNVTIYHNAKTIAESNLMQAVLASPSSKITFSDIIGSDSFRAKKMDVLWCACK